MKVTKSQLRQIIKEEIETTLDESPERWQKWVGQQVEMIERYIRASSDKGEPVGEDHIRYIKKVVTDMAQTLMDSQNQSHMKQG